ncbi:MAG: hypothetical protein JO358_19885 [Alphaproteobacteria bacterium]|nr:hypothetical protein [Alphaproteobacteria bacterium]
MEFAGHFLAMIALLREEGTDRAMAAVKFPQVRKNCGRGLKEEAIGPARGFNIITMSRTRLIDLLFAERDQQLTWISGEVQI